MHCSMRMEKLLPSSSTTGSGYDNNTSLTLVPIIRNLASGTPAEISMLGGEEESQTLHC